MTAFMAFYHADPLRFWLTISVIAVMVVTSELSDAIKKITHRLADLERRYRETK